MATFAQNLAVESWILYSIGIGLIICRLLSRHIQLGSFRKFQLDDYIMIVIAFTFTGVIVTTNQVANNGSNYLPPGAAELLTPEEVVSAIWGSKMTFVLEEFTLATTWLIKACMLLMYNRLTLGLKQHFSVKLVGGYCVVGYIVVNVLFLGVWCRPIQQYWDVPVINAQCATYYNHMITATVFNISSDLMMLAIPLPLLITSKLPIKKKLILCGVFSLGIFVILAAILNRYYNFTVAYSPIFLNWYVGEVSTAVIVANIPLCWPLMRKIFALGAFGDRSSRNEASGTHLHSGSKGIYGPKSGSNSGRRRLDSVSDAELGFNESQERITWPQTRQELELTPVEKNIAFKASVTSGHSQGSKEDWTSKEEIIKTVHVSQYSA